MKKLCTLLLSILFISCTTSIKKNTLGTGCLRFQNYNQEVTILPDEFVDMINEEIEPDSCFLNLIEIFSSREENVSTFLKNFLGKFICPSSKKVPHSQIKFLEKQRTISMDYITFFSLIEDKPPLISNFIPFEEFYDFWYLGKTTFNTNYSSCLILMIDKKNTSYFNVSSLFLLNVKDTQLLSITLIAKSSVFAGEGDFEYLKMEENNTYSYRVITLGEAIVVDEMGNIVEGGASEKTCGMFKFDDQGYVKSLQNK